MSSTQTLICILFSLEEIIQAEYCVKDQILLLKVVDQMKLFFFICSLKMWDWIKMFGVPPNTNGM